VWNDNLNIAWKKDLRRTRKIMIKTEKQKKRRNDDVTEESERKHTKTDRKISSYRGGKFTNENSKHRKPE